MKYEKIELKLNQKTSYIILNETSLFWNVFCSLPNKGIASDTCGKVSATKLRNTVSDRRIVTPTKDSSGGRVSLIIEEKKIHNINDADKSFPFFPSFPFISICFFDVLSFFFLSPATDLVVDIL